MPAQHTPGRPGQGDVETGGLANHRGFVGLRTMCNEGNEKKIEQDAARIGQGIPEIVWSLFRSLR
jgi:hypothetical protein